MSPVPYYLRPKRTRLPKGEPEVLAKPATDAERRSVPPSDWPPVDTSPGPKVPRDAPLAAPPTPPLHRSLPPFDWSSVPATIGRAVPETRSPEPWLDPDVAFWPTFPTQIWPFTGHPTTGVWPTGWMGVDAAGKVWVCTTGGAPGTWTQLNAPSSGTSLLAAVQYAPSVIATYDLTATSITAVDATNLTISFTAPTSGDVLVRLSGFTTLEGAVAGTSYLQFGLVTHGTSTQVGGLACMLAPATNTTWGMNLSAQFLLTGLSGTVSLDWAYKNVSGDNAYLQAGAAGISAPAILEAWSAP